MTRPFRTLLVAATGAMLLGGLLGTSTVNGVRRADVAAGPIYPRAAPPADRVVPAAAPDAGPCVGCTAYDRGYGWAAAHAVDTADACFDDDWARQRGCLAYLAGARRD